MPATSAQDIVKSTPSSMYDSSEHVIDQRSYWLSMSVIFNLKYILGLSIFVSGSSDDSKKDATKVGYVSIL